MGILSIRFLLLIAVLVVGYFLIPKRFQWYLLLAVSMVFYCMSGVRQVVYILITATSTYLAAAYIQKAADRQKAYFKEHKELSKEEKSAYKQKNQKKRRTVLVLMLVLNFGLLCFFKYIHFFVAQVNAVVTAFGGGRLADPFHLLVPLGISFYTFQATGYVLDVYWNKCKAEQNYLKVLLFTSFFPQITQGPISNFKQLSGELFCEHSFLYRNFSWGCQRLLWGFFKKMVIANILAAYVQNVFANYNAYAGITVLIGAFMYSAQIYADFSGYMDIMCGLCEILGIRLTENFDRPYFSKSIAEYWRRWHISLGAWFKNYIYYPVAMAKWNQRLGKAAKERLGKAFGNYLPASVALVLVWLTTGMWHGASWGYIAWGGVNGLFIIFSLWMEHVYDAWKAKLRINESAWLWRAFQTLRTFVLVTFIKVLPEVGTLSDGWGLWKRIFTNHTLPRSFRGLLPFVSDQRAFFAMLFGVGLLLATSLLQRRQPVRGWLEKHIPYLVRIVIFALLFFATVFFGIPASGNAGGFMYAQF